VNTWPSNIKYLRDGYSIYVKPDVNRTTSSTGHTRQRLKNKNRDDLFTVSAMVDDANLVVFENFLKNNSNIYLGPYFDCDVEQEGQLRVIDGSYSVKPIRQNKWRVTWKFEVLDRSHEIGQSLYEFAEVIGDAINDFSNLFAALAAAVNEGF
jgi:hypothetical protein